MLNNIKAMLSYIKLKPTNINNASVSPTQQEDPRSTETRKRVNNYFDANHELLLARGLRPHAYECEDNLICSKDDCWKFVPDKIVSDPYEVKSKRSKALNSPYVGDGIMGPKNYD